jgi:large subunit ribosomal protein L16
MSKSKKKSGLVLSPKLKFKKPSKHLSNLVLNRLTFKGSKVRFAKFAVQAAKDGVMSKGQIEAIRISFRKPYAKKRKATVFVLIKPDQIVTKRSAETRMGRGKGSPIKKIVLIAKGQLLYEVRGPNYLQMVSLFHKTQKKFSFPVNLINSKKIGNGTLIS